MLAAVSLLVLIVAYIAVTPQSTKHWSPLPTIVKADTRLFIGLRYQDSVDVATTLKIIKEALPNEVGMCLYGFAIDTTVQVRDRMSGDIVEKDVKIAVIDSVVRANVDSAGLNFVSYTDGVACDPNKKLIAKAHTHPTTFPFERCEPSIPDVLFAFHTGPKYWFTLVMCPGRNNILWSDGRRFEFSFQNSARGGG